MSTLGLPGAGGDAAAVPSGRRHPDARRNSLHSTTCNPGFFWSDDDEQCVNCPAHPAGAFSVPGTDEVEAVVVVPSSGKISDAQMVTLFGENFVNTGDMQIQWGENYYLCAPGAPTADCPADMIHKRDAITFVSKQELQFRVPTSSSQGTRIVKVSNSGMMREFSKIVTEYTYVQNTDTCPNDCKGVAQQGSDGHGKCGQVGSGFGCNCNLGYSGADCSVGPMVIRLEPSIGLATGGFQVTVIGRNIWVQSKPTTGNTFKVLLDNRAEVSASKATGCADMADCERTN